MWKTKLFFAIIHNVYLKLILRVRFINKFTRIHLAEISSSIAGLHSELLTLTSEQQRGRRVNVNKHVRDMTSLHPFIGKQYIYFLCSGDTCE